MASVMEKPTTHSNSANASQPSGQFMNASQPSAQSKRPTRRAKPRTTFGVRDYISAALGLSAAGAAQFCCNTNMMAALMATAPAHLRKPLWVLLSGTLAAVLFLLVRITNPSRAIAVNRVLSTLVLSRESDSTLPSLALVSILGCLAAIRALPAYDLKLLWAMFCSLGFVVGAIVVKFGGKRPKLVELLDFAWDSISSSLSSSGLPSLSSSGLPSLVR
jgi:TM2 domain-containing membrane protein YozV